MDENLLLNGIQSNFTNTKLYESSKANKLRTGEITGSEYETTSEGIPEVITKALEVLIASLQINHMRQGETPAPANIPTEKDYVPENLDSISEFETPASPDSSYNQDLPEEDDFSRDPVLVPQQLHLTVLDVPKAEEISPSRPQHAVVLYKPLQR
ncbi:hypothetical protein V2J09_002966 [Rumex salicifolius]